MQNIRVAGDSVARDRPWWCNAARTRCAGGEDPCCKGWWSNPMEGCYACQNYCGGC